VVEFESKTREDINDAVLGFSKEVQEERPDGVEEVVPTYRSATVYFGPFIADRSCLEALLWHCASEAPSQPPGRSRTVILPTLYGATWGPDFKDAAAYAGLTPNQVVEVHSSAVYILGFLTAFPYLGSLPGCIACRRPPRPRERVPVASVEITGSQTGVYAQESRGYRRIIGRTPVPLYNPGYRAPTLVPAGNRLRFRPIDEREFHANSSWRFAPPPGMKIWC
jgi:inhibitor of KinA